LTLPGSHALYRQATIERVNHQHDGTAQVMDGRDGWPRHKCRRHPLAAAVLRACARWPVWLLIFFLANNLTHSSPPGQSAASVQLAAAMHGHTHDADDHEPGEAADGDINVHVHPAADRVASGTMPVRLVGAAPLYQRTRNIALRWPSTIPLKPPSPRAAA